MTNLSNPIKWSSPALYRVGKVAPDPCPALIIWGQRRAIAIEYRGNWLAFDITTRPEAKMKLWRSIEQLQAFNSETEIRKAIKAMSDYVAQKDDVVILNDGDTAKVQEVVKGGLLVLTTAGQEIRITDDDIAGQLLNAPFELKSGAHVALLTAPEPELPAWEAIPSGDDDNLPELPDDLWQEIKAGDAEPAAVDNQTVVDTVLNAANPYVDLAAQIAKLQNDLQLAQTQIGQLETDKFNAVREADKAKEALALATALPKADEVSALRRRAEAAEAALKQRQSTPAVSAPDQGYLPYFNEPISAPEQAAAAGRKLQELQTAGWKIRHQQFVQDGGVLRHVAYLEQPKYPPSEFPYKRESVQALVPAGMRVPTSDTPVSVPGIHPTGNPANNSAEPMVIIGLDDDSTSAPADPLVAALKAGVTDPAILQQIGDQQLMQVARSSYQRNTAAPVSRRPFMQVQE